MPLSCPHCLALETVEKLFVLPWCDVIVAAANVTVALAASVWALLVLFAPGLLGRVATGTRAQAQAQSWPSGIADGGSFTSAAAQGAAVGGVPVVFRGALSSPDLGWRALGKWTPSWLSAEVPLFRGATVLGGEGRDFWYVDEGRRELWSSSSQGGLPFLVGQGGGRQKVDLEPSSFWELCGRGGRGWHSSTLARNGDVAPADVSPLEPLLVGAGGDSGNGSPRLSSANSWFGCAGVTTRLHRDLSHNWFVQLYGRKRFRLAPLEAVPGSSRKMYPYTHPLHVHPVGLEKEVSLLPALSCPSFDKELHLTLYPPPKDDNCPEAQAEILLNPGDALYIPPMTFHEVTAMSGADNASISVNVWSRSREEEAAEAIGGGSVLLPLDEDWGGELMAAASLTYLGEVFGSLDAWTAWRESRWLHLELGEDRGAHDEVGGTLFASRPELLSGQRERFKARAGELRSVLSSLVPDTARSRELVFDFADELATFACSKVMVGKMDGKGVSLCLDAWDGRGWS